mmetsp:Transcript_5967/g.8438  ORF Transcript_5967/g.8438 Transcript_5967/m.8438 type:complete len:621 (-) Transcript_5967:155-2017(-)
MAGASPFSFHCMICIEEFHADDRYPVVLPCGHTYVCQCCAERLDKCMECRTPLYEAKPQIYQPPRTVDWNQRHAIGPRSHYRSSGGAQYGGNPTKVKPPAIVKKRLPLPKNVVLLSLMEATELATAHATNSGEVDISPPKENIKPSSSTGVPLVDAYAIFDVEPMDTLDDEDAKEEQKIQAATSLITSACGTYVVRSNEGLTIFPSRPEKIIEGEENVEFGDVDTLMKKKSATESLSPVELSNGDRVQIVSIDDDGWAKLPRGYGFVQTKGNGLLKVAGSVDKACKLEAMLHSLSLARRNLRKQQKYVDNQFVLLMNELQASLINDEDLTVIAGEVFQTPIIHPDLPEESLPEASLIDVSGHGSIPPSALTSARRDSASSQSVREQQQNEQNNIRNVDKEEKVDDGPDIDLSKPVALTRQETPQSLLHDMSLICSLGAGGLLSSGEPEHDEDPLVINSRFRQEGEQSSSTETPSLQQQQEQASAAMSAGAQAWRESRGRPEGTGLDFRAMSGHFGLLSTHAHAHEYLASGNSGPRMMSSHSGLSRQSRTRSNAHENPSPHHTGYEPRMMSCHSGLSISRSTHGTNHSFSRARSSQPASVSGASKASVQKTPSFPPDSTCM